jgi:hypothetical protein
LGSPVLPRYLPSVFHARRAHALANWARYCNRTCRRGTRLRSPRSPASIQRWSRDGIARG